MATHSHSLGFTKDRIKLVCGLPFALLFVASSCSPPARDDERNTAVARKMFEAFNRHAWDTMAGYYADTALFLDPSFGTEYVSKTREETAAKYHEMEAMFPNIHDEVVGMYASGDKVTVEFVSTGTMGDTLNFKLPIITVLSFKEGLIVRDATYYDLQNP
jgi:ketosteroid isomerase-like protein